MSIRIVITLVTIYVLLTGSLMSWGSYEIIRNINYDGPVPFYFDFIMVGILWFIVIGGAYILAHLGISSHREHQRWLEDRKYDHWLKQQTSDG